MPIFSDYRKISSQKLKQNKSRYIQELSKSTSTLKKSPSSLSDSTDQTEQNPKLNLGREFILYSTKQASAQVDKAINQYPKQ